MGETEADGFTLLPRLPGYEVEVAVSYVDDLGVVGQNATASFTFASVPVVAEPTCADRNAGEALNVTWAAVSTVPILEQVLESGGLDRVSWVQIYNGSFPSAAANATLSGLPLAFRAREDWPPVSRPGGTSKKPPHSNFVKKILSNLA